jgi:hypothetical protein
LGPRPHRCHRLSLSPTFRQRHFIFIAASGVLLAATNNLFY